MAATPFSGDQCEINEDGLVWNAGVAFAAGGNDKWSIYSEAANSYRLRIGDALNDDGVYLNQNSNTWSALSDERKNGSTRPRATASRFTAKRGRGGQG